MLTDENYEDLKVKGYTVVTDVLTPDECDFAIGQYREWLSQFQNGDWPYSVNSLIQRYNSGNMAPSWFVRLKSKKVFSQVWHTDKLLSSIDAIAICRPPENNEEEFHRMCDHWLHLDQYSSRDGLHAYQGGVYLEEACPDDWTLQVMEGSHLCFEEFYQTNTRACMRAEMNQYHSLLNEDVKYMEKNGCEIKRVPVPKGSMVLWDSRLVHANTRPLKGRENPGRWRFCVFVSMTPAIWATEEDILKKKEAYEMACMTTHWSSQGIKFFKTSIPSCSPKNTKYPKVLPDIAKSKEAKLISAFEPYDFNDGNPTGEEMLPKWKHRALSSKDSIHWDKGELAFGLITFVGVVLAVGCAGYKLKHR